MVLKREKGSFSVLVIIGVLLAIGLVLAACKGPSGPAGERGPAGPAGVAGPAGSAGPAGATGTVGAAGAAGAPGKAGPAGAPGKGLEFPVTAPGANVPRPLPPMEIPLNLEVPGTDTGMNVTVELSKPANGTHLAAGEKMVVTITLKDKLGATLTKDDFATLNLYMYGPQETAKTVTAVKLLNATTDRTKTPHHYIDLLKDTNVQVQGNTLKYALQAVTNEEAGTYTASLWVIKKGDPPVNQAFVLADFQIGTATVEKQIVEKEKCAACHLGSDSGKFYLHHIDPGRSPYGSPSIDSIPVVTCKSCHNNEGYAAFVSPADGTTRVPDQIVRRVHGVHMGEHLSNPLNIDPKTGIFKVYTGVIFPANVKNCAYCHVDNRWKTQPSRLACGACHDAIDWATGKSVVTGKKDHAGGPQANDTLCATCHPADTGGIKPVAVAHKADEPAGLTGATVNKIDFSLTPPANGKFYVAGETPKLSVVIKDDAGKAIDHTKLDTSSFSTANLFVYGSRYQSVPVLTNRARNGISKDRAAITNARAASGTPPGWTFAAGDTFKLSINGKAPVELTAPVGAQTPAQVRDWLQTALGSDATVTSSATAVTIRSNLQGGEKSRIEIYNSPVTTKMAWKPLGNVSKMTSFRGSGATVEPYVVIGAGSFPNIELRKPADSLDYVDPNVIRNVGDISYQLDNVAGLTPGTYFVYAYVVPNGLLPGTLAAPGPSGQISAAAKALNVSRHGIGLMNFQIGTATEQKKVATNCANCHSNTIWHLDEGPLHATNFDADWCRACHDYSRYTSGDGFNNQGGTTLSGWSGYGAVPSVRRLHQLHRGAYLDHPEQIYSGNPDFGREIIFPQDIRNCTKCHSADTTGTWKTEPSRLACMSCHDSDRANSHALLNTFNPNPADPWNSARVETCKTCHGAGREFSPDKMHNISKPYKPPYPREPEER
ncbi:MAG: MULTIHEME CYTC protein [Dehalococcoidia bacterium]|nr:MULTIHEME CYTC protein [Dehalococcoidia bacterium]